MKLFGFPLLMASFCCILVIGCQEKATSPETDGLLTGVEKGFDQYGYNYQAKIFVGKADGVDRILDGKVWGDPTYANDHLVMKWSKAWDDARFKGAPWTPDAWEDNEWNGNVPGGSGESEHFKCVWVGPSKWLLSGNWALSFNFGGSLYDHTMTVANFDPVTGAFSGTGYYNPDHSYTWNVTGTLIGNTLTMHIVYTGTGAGYTNDATGTIDGTGTLLSGTWADNASQSGTWTGSGAATVDNGPYWREGGYRIWGEFEAIFDMYKMPGGHFFLAKANPAGYGMK